MKQSRGEWGRQGERRIGKRGLSERNWEERRIIDDNGPVLQGMKMLMDVEVVRGSQWLDKSRGKWMAKRYSGILC